MLKVPSVDRTVSYWTEQMGSVLRSRENDEGSLQSAFVALGNGTSTEHCFALELIQTKDFQLGNCLSYVGISMLLQFQNNLRGAANGETPAALVGDEPNGIAVKSSASAPGDYFCRFCLKSNDLVATQNFYASLLKMNVMAVDDDMLCLRYDSGGSVPTTLIFERTDDELVKGTCFDHLAIFTSCNIEDEYKRLQAAGATINMNPTEMFGSTVMGLRDPNGYKVVLASE